MPHIGALIRYLQSALTPPPHQLSHLIFGLLVMTSRVTMLVISRWTGDGASYRCVGSSILKVHQGGESVVLAAAVTLCGR